MCILQLSLWKNSILLFSRYGSCIMLCGCCAVQFSLRQAGPILTCPCLRACNLFPSLTPRCTHLGERQYSSPSSGTRIIVLLGSCLLPACFDYCTIFMTGLTFDLVLIILIQRITRRPRPFQPCSCTPGAQSRRV